MNDGYLFKQQRKVPWRQSTLADGVWVKNLVAANGRATQLVRYEPGARFPMHRHAGPEFLYVLEGEAIQYGQRLGPVSASVAATGTEEDGFTSETGCTFLLVYTE